MIIIRELREDDIDNACEELKSYLEESNINYKMPKKWSLKEAQEMLFNGINNSESLCLGAFSDKQILGIFCMATFKNFMEDYKTGVEVVWHVNPKLVRFRKSKIMYLLLETAQNWAKFNNIKKLMLGVPHKSSLAKSLFKRGFFVEDLILKKEVL